MAGSARIGQFSAPSGSYGAPVPIAKPADNQTAPLPAPTTSPTQAQLDDLYARLKALAGR